MDQVGKWQLVSRLGEGGNARVWRARDEQGVEVAVKVLARRGTEAYGRFRQEIHVLQGLGERRGILPLLDSHLPEAPNVEDPAWLAMPIARGLAGYLSVEDDLVSVVAAMAGIAATLAELSREGIAHRDIKPANLFWLDGETAIGDFGLVDYPGKESLTVECKKLGPRHYLAPEMLFDPIGALAAPADVYSLAKSLWVLSTGQKFPPPGEQRRDTPGVLLSSYVEHRRAHVLDALIEDATRHDPG
ncbi:MAG: protein kinase, partial [Actinomycetota bacterium]|nr:protein kinase [Actinomycetota bacterium]